VHWSGARATKVEDDSGISRQQGVSLAGRGCGCKIVPRMAGGQQAVVGSLDGDIGLSEGTKIR
jgi:hypothetical protein